VNRLIRAGGADNEVVYGVARELLSHGVLDGPHAAKVLAFAAERLAECYDTDTSLGEGKEGTTSPSSQPSTLAPTLLFVTDALSDSIGGVATRSDQSVLASLLRVVTRVLSREVSGARDPDLSVVWACQLALFRLGIESPDAVRELCRSLSHLSALAATRGPSYSPSPLEAPTEAASDPVLYTLAGAVYAIAATLPSSSGNRSKKRSGGGAGGGAGGDDDDLGTVDAVTQQLLKYPTSPSLLQAAGFFARQVCARLIFISFARVSFGPMDCCAEL
jgi:hypothetical protein